MAITLVRVDDRIIHGQTTTRWTKARDVWGIIVIGDRVANDELRKKVLKAAAGNHRLGVYPESMGPEIIEKAKDSTKKFFVIAESPLVFENIVKLGAKLEDTINIGPMNAKPGAKNLGSTLSLSERDVESFQYLNDSGYNLSFQVIPDDKPRNWNEVINKYNSL